MFILKAGTFSEGDYIDPSSTNPNHHLRLVVGALRAFHLIASGRGGSSVICELPLLHHLSYSPNLAFCPPGFFFPHPGEKKKWMEP